MYFVLYSAMIVIGITVGVIFYNYTEIRKLPDSTQENMLQLASIIRNGARIFIFREYRVIVPVSLFVAAIFALFIDPLSFFTLLLGILMSSLSCVTGMDSGTYANVHTAEIARRLDRNNTFKIGLRGGSVSGLSVNAFGYLGVVIVFFVNLSAILNPVSNGHGLLLSVACNPATTRLTTYSLGCSIVAMFNRVAGGNYTKAADISADIVAKNRHNLPEDDARMPNTIADFIGDLVNDIAGNCSDLCESYVATVVSSVLIAINLAQSAPNASPELLQATAVFPIMLAGAGLLACVISIIYISTHRSSGNASQEVNMVTYIAAGLTIIFGIILSWIAFSGLTLYNDFHWGWISPCAASIFGIIAGVIVGRITEYYTGVQYTPVQVIAKFAKEGFAFALTKTDAVGDHSSLPSMLVIVTSIITSYMVSGIYGIAIASLGMLSFVGATVSIDAFGPIADNAGGIAESCHLPPEVRVITDELDALGNTTAAIGKGLAIGSASSATLALLIAYVGAYTIGSEPTLNILNIWTMSGSLVGAAIVPYFSALLTNNTIDSAYLMAQEGDRQLSIPGVLDGTVAPDYEKVIKLAADEALRKMPKPSIIAIVTPALCGMIFGPEFVGGMLLGATLVAIPKAIFMGNSGGAADNAKKAIESGLIEGCGKGSDAHKVAVACDTVGDTRKDVVGVDLDILIKMMSTIANTMAPIFASFHLL